MSTGDLATFVEEMNGYIQKGQFWKVMVIDQSYQSFIYNPVEAIELVIKEGQTTLTMKSKEYQTSLKIQEIKRLDRTSWKIKTIDQRTFSLVFAVI